MGIFSRCDCGRSCVHRQVGIEVQRSGNIFALGRNQTDASDSVAYAKKIQDFVPRAVINAAPYKGLDNAEADKERATIINGDTLTAITHVSWR